MARVHLFNSSTQPYNYNKQGSPHSIAEEPLLSEDIIDNTTIVENASSDSSSSNDDVDETTQLVTSNAALTAALLQNARENNDMVEAVAAAFSVKTGKINIRTTIFLMYLPFSFISIRLLPCPTTTTTSR